MKIEEYIPQNACRAIAPGFLDNELFRLQTLQHASPEEICTVLLAAESKETMILRQMKIRLEMRFLKQSAYNYGRIVSFGKDVAEAPSFEIEMIDFRKMMLHAWVLPPLEFDVHDVQFPMQLRISQPFPQKLPMYIQKETICTHWFVLQTSSKYKLSCYNCSFICFSSSIERNGEDKGWLLNLAMISVIANALGGILVGLVTSPAGGV
ncbi:hypothetical protein QYF36_007971 [Acer negundo]|nr:hypothetical protein QYF36_007971 [Acer negundo]